MIAPNWAEAALVSSPVTNVNSTTNKFAMCSKTAYAEQRSDSSSESTKFKLTAWLLSASVSKQKVFQEALGTYSPRRGERVPKKTTNANFVNSVIGVHNNKLIRIQHL